MTDTAFFKSKSIENMGQARAYLAHHTRAKTPDYVLTKDEVQEHNLGQNWGERYTEPEALLDEIKQVEKTRGRKFSKLTKPLREAVILTRPDHTPQDIKRCVKALARELNLRPLWVYEHRDEGRVKDGKLTSHNTHLHLGFTMFDKDKAAFTHLDRNKLKEAQKIIARELNLKVGTPRTKDSPPALGHKEYRRIARRKEALEAQQKMQLSPDEKNQTRQVKGSQGSNREAVPTAPFTGFDAGETIQHQGKKPDILEELKDVQNRAYQELKAIENESDKVVKEFNAAVKEHNAIVDLEADIKELPELEREAGITKAKLEVAQRAKEAAQKEMDKTSLWTRKKTNQKLQGNLNTKSVMEREAKTAHTNAKAAFEAKQAKTLGKKPDTERKAILKKLIEKLRKTIDALKARGKGLQALLRRDVIREAQKEKKLTTRSLNRDYGGLGR